MPVCDNNLAAEMALQEQSPLFGKLPPEIRNDIFEYVFTTGGSSSHKDLAKPERPCIDLLFTCQRVFAESSSVYDSARTAFWAENTFYISRRIKDLTNGPPNQDIVNNLHDKEIDLIRKIVVVFEIGRFWTTQEWHLTPRSDGMHGWVIARPLQDDAELLTMVGKKSGLLKALAIVS
jgi:hypothetical protein